MLFERKIIKEINNLKDFRLLSTELELSVYRDVAKYLSDNKCKDGEELVNKRIEQMDKHISGLKYDFSEINNIFFGIRDVFKINEDEKSIPNIINIRDKEISIIYGRDVYKFIYCIGFDEFEKLYKYGVIKASIDKNKLIEKSSKIAFSEEGNLSKLLDIKSYFEDLQCKLEKANNIKELTTIIKSIEDEIIQIFNLDKFSDIVLKDNEIRKMHLGISAIDIYRDFNKAYGLKNIKIQLALAGEEVNDDSLLNLILQEIYRIQIVQTGEELYKDATLYQTILDSKNKEITQLMKNINIDKNKLDSYIDKLTELEEF